MVLSGADISLLNDLGLISANFMAMPGNACCGTTDMEVDAYYFPDIAFLMLTLPIDITVYRYIEVYADMPRPRLASTCWTFSFRLLLACPPPDCLPLV